jgi:hypothetical protein
MKITLIAATLFFLAIPAHAQRRFAGGAATPTQLNFAGAGGGGGFGTSGFGSSGFGASLFSMPATSQAPEHYTYIYAQGSEATYVPTRFVSFATALKMGKAALAYHPKSIAEAAAEYRAKKEKLNH